MIECIHHWYLGPSHGGTVHATCRKCGAEKDYPPVVISRFGRVHGYKNGKAVLNPKPHSL